MEELGKASDGEGIRVMFWTQIDRHSMGWPGGLLNSLIVAGVLASALAPAVGAAATRDEAILGSLAWLDASQLDGGLWAATAEGTESAAVALEAFSALGLCEAPLAQRALDSLAGASPASLDERARVQRAARDCGREVELDGVFEAPVPAGVDPGWGVVDRAGVSSLDTALHGATVR